MPRLLPLLALPLLLAACGSTGGGASNDLLRATLIDYGEGTTFELRSEAVTDRVELYSEPRPNARTKVESQDFMDAVAEQMGVLGFEAWAVGGPAPRTGAGRWQKAIELETPSGIRHVASAPDVPPEQRAAVFDMTRAFVFVFGQSRAYQTVENQSGSEIFKGPTLGGNGQ